MAIEQTIDAMRHDEVIRVTGPRESFAANLTKICRAVPSERFGAM